MRISRNLGWLLVPLIASSGFAAPASLERIFKENKIKEAWMHTGQIPPLDMVHTIDKAKTMKSYLPRCKGSGSIRVPYVYTKEYRLSRSDNKKFGKILRSLRKYRDVRKAVAAGYLLGTDYENGAGIPFANPDLIIRKKVNWTKPTILFYVKTRKKQSYRLVSAAYYAAGAKPTARFDAAPRRKSDKPEPQWRPFDGVCLTIEKNQAVYTIPKNGAAECPGGKFMKKGWMLHLALPVFNPSGLFAPQNPIADYLDLRERKYRFCYE